MKLLRCKRVRSLQVIKKKKLRKLMAVNYREDSSMLSENKGVCVCE